ncbi:hypothetical protein [uncultured Ilyobacter sp.]|uniref:hypothetical protein n=1 Tax=uncultured Ilyobacter sp. TaxID=544433 RepID=UPI0029F52096|nr:hypothetical protein [uncultured Ilyobacter sp.]
MKKKADELLSLYESIIASDDKVYHKMKLKVKEEIFKLLENPNDSFIGDRRIYEGEILKDLILKERFKAERHSLPLNYILFEKLTPCMKKESIENLGMLMLENIRYEDILGYIPSLGFVLLLFNTSKESAFIIKKRLVQSYEFAKISDSFKIKVIEEKDFSLLNIYSD